jgi:hypothetical protein
MFVDNRHERLLLAGDPQAGIRVRVEQRLDPERITAGVQNFLHVVPRDEAEHASQPVQT